jgi:hypothetical protein
MESSAPGGRFMATPTGAPTTIGGRGWGTGENGSSDGAGWLPYNSPCHSLFLVDKPGGPMDQWRGRTKPEEQWELMKEALRTYTPQFYERCEDAELVDGRSRLIEKVSPQVRNPVGILPSGGRDTIVQYWSIGEFGDIANGIAAFTPAQQEHLRDLSKGLPAPEAVDALREAGIETVVLVNDWLPGSEWQHLQFAEDRRNVVRNARNQALRGRAVRKGSVLPQMTEHLQQMRFPAPVEPADPGSLLARPAEAVEKGTDYLLHTVGKLPFADEGREFAPQLLQFLLPCAVGDSRLSVVDQPIPGGISMEDLADRFHAEAPAQCNVMRTARKFHPARQSSNR